MKTPSKIPCEIRGFLKVIFYLMRCFVKKTFLNFEKYNVTFLKLSLINEKVDKIICFIQNYLKTKNTYLNN